ncbi:MAG: CPBP family intramembrane glutamic endopeptidase [Clostridia bacterium]|nr:CPBP family intramembrane glutamic endopeptidase [Clostridia bacterium]
MPKIKNSHQLSPSGVQWLLFTIILLWFFFTFVYSILHSFFSFEKPNGYLQLMYLQIFTIMLPTILYLYPKNIDITETFLIHRINRKNVLFLVGLGICMQYIGRMLNSLMVLLLRSLGTDSPVSSLAVPDSFGAALLALVAVVMVPAVMEELLMRGVVLHAYVWRGNKAAIAASAFLFGILHLDVRSLFSTILLGAVLAYAVLQTGSIWAGMILHLVNNLIALIGYALERHLQQPWEGILLTLFFAAAVLAVFPLLRAFRAHNLENKNRVDLPEKKSVAYELGRTIFSLPGLLTLAGYVLVQIQLFGRG